MNKAVLSLVKEKFVLTKELKEEAYALFPRKGEGKKKGMLAMDKEIRSWDEYKRFKQAVHNYAELCRQRSTERHYIKMWPTFVNNWTDYEDATELGLRPQREEW